MLFLFNFRKWHIHCMYIWYRKYIFLCHGKVTNMKLVYVLTHAVILFQQWQSIRTLEKHHKKPLTNLPFFVYNWWLAIFPFSRIMQQLLHKEILILKSLPWQSFSENLFITIQSLRNCRLLPFACGFVFLLFFFFPHSFCLLVITLGSPAFEILKQFLKSLLPSKTIVFLSTLTEVIWTNFHTNCLPELQRYETQTLVNDIPVWMFSTT